MPEDKSAIPDITMANTKKQILAAYHHLSMEELLRVLEIH